MQLKRCLTLCGVLPQSAQTVEANILTDSALVGAEESTMSGSKLGKGRAFLPG